MHLTESKHKNVAVFVSKLQPRRTLCIYLHLRLIQNNATTVKAMFQNGVLTIQEFYEDEMTHMACTTLNVDIQTHPNLAEYMV